jgi:hypothetical protein
MRHTDTDTGSDCGANRGSNGCSFDCPQHSAYCSTDNLAHGNAHRHTIFRANRCTDFCAHCITHGQPDSCTY